MITPAESERIDEALVHTVEDFHEKPESEKAEYRMAYAMLRSRRQQQTSNRSRATAALKPSQ